MEIHVADAEILDKILRRKRKSRNIDQEVDLSAVLREILTRANEFVPSESGSILLDDPFLKLDSRRRGRLYFLACFGKGSSSLAGTSLPDHLGIIGETYHSSRAYISEDVSTDKKYYPLRVKSGRSTQSVICTPIAIDDSVVGVIELINRKNRITFEKKDLSLLKIFAGYTATLIKNALDARRFEELSKKDNLTGLYNDRYLFQKLHNEIREAVRTGGDVTLIFFDLDRFKEVNDTNGHLAGSRVLKEIASILEEVFLNTNAIICRYGGDEYVILLPHTGLKKAMRLAEKVRAEIERFVFLKKKGPFGEAPLRIAGLITCSMGLASLREHVRMGTNTEKMAENLIKAADQAMYRAKDTGKNRVFVIRD